MKRTSFSADVICRANFQALQPAAQALYLQLSMAADDAGACDSLTVANSYGPEALEALISAGFIIRLDDIFVVTHFVKNNTRRHLHLLRSHYKDLIASKLSLGEDDVYRVKTAEDLAAKTTKTETKATRKATDNSLAVEVISYLNARTGKRYSAKTAAHTKFINGRAAEGYTLEDFKKVIDNRVEAWGKDKKMCEYLRPTTLFAPTHFSEYLNANVKAAGKFEAKTSDAAGIYGRDFFEL